MKPTNSSSSQKSLIFIPDISGFSKFVHETDPIHSQHIIKELLEALIDANEMGLEISEIEGDAILFYKKDYKPTASELLAQVERMFVKFHACLKQYESEHTCTCGASIKPSNLSLKFVVHYGNISITQVKNRSKLFGKDVILAHRLLKNNLPLNDYVLFTQALIDHCSTWGEISEKAWEHPVLGSEYYDFGPVAFGYLPLTPLQSHIEQAPIENAIHDVNLNKLLSIESIINAPIDQVFNLLNSCNTSISSLFPIKEKSIKSPLNLIPSPKEFNNTVTWINKKQKDGTNLVITLYKIGNGLTRTNFTILEKQNPIKILHFNLFKRKSLIALYNKAINNLNVYYSTFEPEVKTETFVGLQNPVIRAVA